MEKDPQTTRSLTQSAETVVKKEKYLYTNITHNEQHMATSVILNCKKGKAGTGFKDPIATIA